MKRRIKDNEATPKFTWKTSEEIKTMGLQSIENLHYEEQKLNTRFYLS